MTLQRTLVAVGCGIAMVASLGGLAVATGVGAIDSLVTKGLPSVVSAWRTPSDHIAAIEAAKLSPVVLRAAAKTASGPVARDEGYWLNTKMLAGGDGASLALGQQMTIADRIYVISEMRPLLSESAEGESVAGGHFTLVVAREANADSGQPRTLRFLIDGTQAVPPATPPAAIPAPAHRTL